MTEKLLAAKFVSATPQEEALMDGVITVMCPFCGEERQIEPDGYYDDIECENCEAHYSTMGVV